MVVTNEQMEQAVNLKDATKAKLRDYFYEKKGNDGTNAFLQLEAIYKVALTNYQKLLGSRIDEKWNAYIRDVYDNVLGEM